jgi:hypothetical protein
MDLFGRKRVMAVDVAVANIRPLIASVQQTRGIPIGFWEDDYVLGFIGSMISFNLRAASRGSLSPHDEGLALSDVFSQVTNLNGQEIVQRYSARIRAVFLPTPDTGSEFYRGSDNAAVIWGYGGRILRNEEQNPAVNAAKALSTGQAQWVGGSDRELIAANLLGLFRVSCG